MTLPDAPQPPCSCLDRDTRSPHPVHLPRAPGDIRNNDRTWIAVPRLRVVHPLPGAPGEAHAAHHRSSKKIAVQRRRVVFLRHARG
jgi:hypothetical protein